MPPSNYKLIFISSKFLLEIFYDYNNKIEFVRLNFRMELKYYSNVSCPSCGYINNVKIPETM